MFPWAFFLTRQTVSAMEYSSFWEYLTGDALCHEFLKHGSVVLSRIVLCPLSRQSQRRRIHYMCTLKRQFLSHEWNHYHNKQALPRFLEGQNADTSQNVCLGEEAVGVLTRQQPKANSCMHYGVDLHFSDWWLHAWYASGDCTKWQEHWSSWFSDGSLLCGIHHSLSQHHSPAIHARRRSCFVIRARRSMYDCQGDFLASPPLIAMPIWSHAGVHEHPQTSGWW